MDGTPASKLCSPRESVRSTTPDPGQGEVAAPVLSWACSPLELAPAWPWVRQLASPHAIGDEPRPHAAPGTQRLATFASTELRYRVHEPGIRRRAESIGSARHRQAATQLERTIASRAHASHQPRRPPSRVRLARRLARAPSRQRPAPPSPFAASSHEGRRSLDLGDALFRAVLGGPASREASRLFWGFVPRRVGS